ncbi:hypothetical protein LguiA_017871 [Lonicera macranthoides]
MGNLGLVLGVTSRAGYASEVKCMESKRRALLEFKHSLVDYSSRLSSWGTSHEVDCCKWRGVKCSNLTRHITLLDLHGLVEGSDFQMLRGEVSPSLLQLKHLNYLDLSSNVFGTKFPEFIGSLTKLQHLNLHGSDFYGPIPHQLGNLTNLGSLDLGDNIGLTVKNLEWLSHLCLLRYLDLSTVSLENTNWLQPITMLSFLTELRLPHCNLPGNVSRWLPLTNSSSIPLTIIDLSHNSLHSSLSYDWLVNFSSISLVELNMRGNPLGDSIPDAFGNLVSLEKLDLSRCQLREKSLEYLYLEVNRFSGSLPDFTRFSSLRELQLAGNEMNGSFPESFDRISSLVFLDVSRNQMMGPLPDLEFLPSLRELRLKSNKLNGRIPKSLGQFSKLEILDVSSNSFEGEFPDCWTEDRKLMFLSLANNNLSGEIPSSIGLLIHLRVLQLRNNSIAGELPFSLKSCKELMFVDLGLNNLSGEVPAWIGMHLKKLIVLSLRRNKFNGSIPLEICQLSLTQILDLS